MCVITCLGIAAGAGAGVLGLSILLGNLMWMQGIFFAAIAFAVIFAFLSIVFCRALPGPGEVTLPGVHRIEPETGTLERVRLEAHKPEMFVRPLRPGEAERDAATLEPSALQVKFEEFTTNTLQPLAQSTIARVRDTVSEKLGGASPETRAPATTPPVARLPAAEQPVTEQPVTEQPVTEQPVAATPPRQATPIATLAPSAPAPHEPVADAPPVPIHPRPADEDIRPAPVEMPVEMPRDATMGTLREPAALPNGAADDAGKPELLGAPRDGQADDLKRIRGVGPKLEGVLHDLGIYHYDQIATWGPKEIEWVDDHLEGFRGRVARDDWVAQATTLASGGSTEFSRRVEDGEIY